jgi:glycosyltransferase involved in cell wall biosynthesis
MLPDKKLLVIYGENDPAKEKIFNLAKWYKNITFVTLPGNVGFTDYVGKCIATIYIPVDEDFGMSPVESMSAGKPVLWVNEWWLKETIIDKKTWVLIPEWAQVSDIIRGVKYLTPEKCLKMRTDCEDRAQDFSLVQFEKKLKDLVQ